MRTIAVTLLFALVALPLAAAEPEMGTVKSADGVEVAYDVRGKGDTALVFIHGWSGDREYWKHQVEPFAADYRVVTLDLPGHGRSGRDRKTWTTTGFASDVEAVIKKLELKRVFLIGHSMGGPIALATAKRLPGVVIGVVGVDTLKTRSTSFRRSSGRSI
jgi:pimeloyl-ACP methyl ester carboxylesterase